MASGPPDPPEWHSDRLSPEQQRAVGQCGMYVRTVHMYVQHSEPVSNVCTVHMYVQTVNQYQMYVQYICTYICTKITSVKMYVRTVHMYVQTVNQYQM